jgi:glyoxylase-like metal-dependent hydrolase (beta-lactamase superfamily II)
MSKALASQGDLAPKRETFDELAPGVFALTAEGDPNSGVVIGDDSVLVIDARATPVMAKELVAHIRKVTDKPIRHVLLTHYHAVRVLGVAGYEERVNVIASDVTRGMIVERGAQDMESEIQRFPRLFRARETIPGLTWPNVVFHKQLTLWLGSREVQIIHAGCGHTRGDTIAWLPTERVLFSGDLVEYGATPYCGDAHFTDWPGTLERVASFGAQALVPGRGEALTTPEKVGQGIAETRSFLQDVFRIAREGAAADQPLKQVYDRALQELRPKYGHWVIFDHCMPFDVSRAYDEA